MSVRGRKPIPSRMQKKNLLFEVLFPDELRAIFLTHDNRAGRDCKGKNFFQAFGSDMAREMRRPVSLHEGCG